MMHDDDYEDWNYVRAADLEHAETGYQLCDDCGGKGTHLGHKAYPNGPCEYEYYCETCEGDGQVWIPEKASISRNKREGLYQGKTHWTYNIYSGTHKWNEQNKHRRGQGSGLKHRGYATTLSFD